MEMLLKSVWTKTLLSRLVSKNVKKMSGYDILFKIKDMDVKGDDKEVNIHLDLNVKMSVSELQRLLTSIGI